MNRNVLVFVVAAISFAVIAIFVFFNFTGYHGVDHVTDYAAVDYIDGKVIIYRSSTSGFSYSGGDSYPKENSFIEIRKKNGAPASQWELLFRQNDRCDFGQIEVISSRLEYGSIPGCYISMEPAQEIVADVEYVIDKAKPLYPRNENDRVEFVLRRCDGEGGSLCLETNSPAEVILPEEKAFIENEIDTLIK